MLNVQQFIKGHNQTIFRNSAQPTQDQAERACNCRKKEECPLEGNCLSKGIVYQAQVTSASKTETYVGLTATEFKVTFRKHQVLFNNKTRKNNRAYVRIMRVCAVNVYLSGTVASTSGSLKAKNNTSPLNGRSLPRRNPTPI